MPFQRVPSQTVQLSHRILPTSHALKLASPQPTTVWRVEVVCSSRYSLYSMTVGNRSKAQVLHGPFFLRIVLAPPPMAGGESQTNDHRSKQHGVPHLNTQSKPKHLRPSKVKSLFCPKATLITKLQKTFDAALNPEARQVQKPSKHSKHRTLPQALGAFWRAGFCPAVYIWAPESQYMRADASHWRQALI